MWEDKKWRNGKSGEKQIIMYQTKGEYTQVTLKEKI